MRILQTAISRTGVASSAGKLRSEWLAEGVFPGELTHVKAAMTELYAKPRQVRTSTCGGLASPNPNFPSTILGRYTNRFDHTKMRAAPVVQAKGNPPNDLTELPPQVLSPSTTPDFFGQIATRRGTYMLIIEYGAGERGTGNTRCQAKLATGKHSLAYHL